MIKKFSIFSFQFSIPKKQSGMTLFIAVAIMGILLLISFAVVNITVKSTLFSSSGRDSQFAFYAADAGLECALYWDSIPATSKFDPTTSGSPISCGGSVIATGAAPLGTTTATLVGGGGSGGSASIAVVNTGTGSSYAGASAGTIATNAFSVSSGNLIIVSVRYYRNTGQNISSITDTASNTYVNIAGFTTSVGDRMEVWYAKNTNANASNIVTANFSVAVTYMGIDTVQYSGVDTASPLDAIAISTSQSGAIVTSDPFTTVGNNEVIVAAAQISNINTNWTAGAGYATQVQDSPNRVMIIEDKIVSSTQSGVTASASNSDGVSVKSIIVATFRAANSGGGNPTSTFGFMMNQGLNPTSACAIVTVTKNGGGTYIKSRGYNTCDTTNPRRIERGVEVTY